MRRARPPRRRRQHRLPVADFDQRISELDPSATYAVYCRSGNRSGQAMDRMGVAGFTDVTNMGGGVVDWANAGFPLE